MDIWLLRHAATEDRSPSGRDEDRRLTAHGRADCHALHAMVRDCGLDFPSVIRVSPALRAQETARTVLGHLPVSPPINDARLWNASVGDLVALLDQTDDLTAGLMLIAHNPGLEGLVRWLGGQLPATGMKPGTLCVLQIRLPLTPQSSRTVKIFQPSDAV